MAAELVETSRLWARVVARIEPEWAEPLAGHLVKRTLQRAALGTRPGLRGRRWRRSRSTAAARRRPEGPLRPDRPGAVARAVHPARPGRGRLADPPHVLRRQPGLLDEVEELEHRARRRDILVDDETLFAFYDARIPADVVSARHFDTWWKQARRDRPGPAHLRPRRCWSTPARAGSTRRLPGHVAAGRARLRADLPVRAGRARRRGDRPHPAAVLNQVAPAGFDWQVPGLREDLVTALIRSLPKALRRNLVPGPDHAADSSAGGRPDRRTRPALLDALEAYLRGLRIPVARKDWDPARCPPTCAHLPGRGRDRRRAGRGQGPAPRCGAQLAPQAREVVADLADDVEQAGLRRLDAGHAGQGGPAPAAGVRRHRLPGAGRRGATAWRCGCSTPQPSRSGRCGPAPAGCCCSRCRPRCRAVQTAAQRGQAGPDPVPVLERAGPARGLRAGRGRRA